MTYNSPFKLACLSPLHFGVPSSLLLTIASVRTNSVDHCKEQSEHCISAEMVTWMPISSPFVRFSDHFVDPALGFCAGINFFVFEAILIPFEIVAFNIVITFWTEKIPLVVVIILVLVCYAYVIFIALNLLTLNIIVF